MRIGFGFDNTIVSYDALFYRVAVEKGIDVKSLPVNKIAIRDYLRSMGQEKIWTAMQGDVYGARMQEAVCYPDVLSVINKLKNNGHTLAIISHKTKYPYLGIQHDLHLSAHQWIASFLKNEEELLISKENIFFELSKEEKLIRIKDFSCDIFIDDLPEILLSEQFPSSTERFLFDPEGHHSSSLPYLNIVSSWKSLEKRLL